MDRAPLPHPHPTSRPDPARPHRPSLPIRAAACGAAALALTLGACTSDARDEAGDTASSVGEEIEDSAGSASAATIAASWVAAIKADATVDDEGARSVSGLEDSAADLPGEPEIGGIDDGDGDGLDDDGRVWVTVEDQSACLVLPDAGEDIDVQTGAC